MHLPLSLKLRKKEIKKILLMFTILSQEVKKDMMKILLKCTRRPQVEVVEVEVVEVEDEEDIVEVEDLIVEMENKMVWNSVIEDLKMVQRLLEKVKDSLEMM